MHDQKAASLTFEGQIREGNNRREIIMHYFTIEKKGVIKVIREQNF